MPHNDNKPRNSKLTQLSRALLSALVLGSASWTPAVYSADETPSDTDVDDIELEQGSMAAEIKRLTDDRHRLEAKEKELQKTIKQQTQHLQDQQRALEEQSRKIQQQQSTFDEQKRRLDELKVKIEDLAIPPVGPEEVPSEGAAQPQVPAPPPSPPPAAPAPPVEAPRAPAPPPPPPQQAPATVEKAPAPPPQQAPAAAEKEAPAPTGPVGRAPQPGQTRPAQIADVLEQRGILTPHGTLVVEPQFQYTNSSVTQVTLQGYTILPALLIGTINIDSVRHDTVTTALGMRYGITNHFEVETQIPYVHRDDQTSTRPLNAGANQDTITKVSGDGLGDIEIAGHYQFNDGLNGAPYLIGNLRIKSTTGRGPFDVPVDVNGLQTKLPTGTGFWAVQPSITFSLPSDPAVFFGSMSYLYNVQHKVNDTIGTIKPGNAIGLSLGMGMALNEDASFSLGYSHNMVEPSTQNGETIKGSQRLQVGVLLIGMSYRTGRNSSFNFGLGMGVTQDAPNVQVSLGVPLSLEFGKQR